MAKPKPKHKPKPRIGRAAIADMLGVDSVGVDSNDAGGPAAAVAMTQSADLARQVDRDDREESHTSHPGHPSHPVRDRAESGVARAENALVLDPRRVVQRGRYVRPFTDDRRFHELLTAIEEAGQTIHVPILVRVEGPPGDVEYVLVDGTHRLEAAIRLGISVPAVNLGRIPPERAFAIQAMANEVRASMHVVDQAAYVAVLEAQGLSRDSVRRTTGFSAGRVSELASLGKLLATIDETELSRARHAPTVTHRALRALKAVATNDAAFRRGVLALVAEAELAQQGGAEGEPDAGEMGTMSFRPDGSIQPQFTPADIGSPRYQLRPTSTPKGRRGRKALAAGGVSFASARNRRGTSVTFRMAWRARAVRQNPDLFLERVREALHLIAAEATAQYESATAQPPVAAQGRSVERADSGAQLRRGSVTAERPASAASAAAPEAADLVMPEWENPMPMPASQRAPNSIEPSIDPRLLAGLSLPMLADRLRRRSTEFQKLDKRLTDAERRAHDTRKRVQGIIGADETDRRGDR
jgi:ParB-like chromosome segregation protein Spo0J